MKFVDPFDFTGSKTLLIPSPKTLPPHPPGRSAPLTEAELDRMQRHLAELQADLAKIDAGH